MNNRDAAASGDRRLALEELRDTLAEQLDLTEAQIHAQLAAQYRATLAELDALATNEPVAEEGVNVVNLKSRRKGRRPAADASANA